MTVADGITPHPARREPGAAGAATAGRRTHASTRSYSCFTMPCAALEGGEADLRSLLHSARKRCSDEKGQVRLSSSAGLPQLGSQLPGEKITVWQCIYCLPKKHPGVGQAAVGRPAIPSPALADQLMQRSPAAMPCVLRSARRRCS